MRSGHGGIPCTWAPERWSRQEDHRFKVMAINGREPDLATRDCLKYKGWDGSVGEGACCQTRQPDFGARTQEWKKWVLQINLWPPHKHHSPWAPANTNNFRIESETGKVEKELYGALRKESPHNWICALFFYVCSFETGSYFCLFVSRQGFPV